MVKRKESDINELIFRIVVLLILFLAFKPFYIYIHLDDKPKQQAVTKNIENIKQEALVISKINSEQNRIKNLQQKSAQALEKANDIKINTNNKPKAIVKKIAIKSPNSMTAKKEISRQQVALNIEEINNYVEKINAYIEEQDFLLSSIDVENENMPVILDTIKANLEDIKKQAEQNKIGNLINNRKIDELETNIESYKQVIDQVKNL